jgi:hypothetical protein
MCAEELTDEAALTRVRRVLLDVDAVPYVSQLFAAQNPPKPVSVRLLYVENKFCSVTANGKPSVGAHRVVLQVPSATRHPSTGSPSPQRRSRSEEGSSSRGYAQQ